MPTNTHLYLFRQTYYFRCRIPSDLKDVFGGKDDFKRSLRTKSLTQARKMLKIWDYKADYIFTLMRSGMLTARHICRLVEDFKNNDFETKWGGPITVLPDVGGQEAVRNLATEKTHSSKQKGAVALSVVVEKYIQEYKSTEKAGGPSIYEIETKCWLFVRVAGDMDIELVTRDTILDFLGVLKQLPKNMSKHKVYDGKTIAEVMAMKPQDTLSDTTIINYMVRVNSFFTWAMRVGYIDRNPADGVKHGKTKMVRPDELRKAYSRDDLRKLVAAYAFMAPENKAKFAAYPDRFWLPIISLYSGMRLNEICQLNTNDIAQDAETGIWYFHIETSDGDEKMIKSASARRKIPLHGVLIKLGLLEYRTCMVKSCAPRLWMNLKLTGRGYHKSFANWFLGNGCGKGFLRKHVTTDDKLNFHSFRHTFIDTLKQKRVDERILVEIAGHSNKSMTFGRYGKPYSLQDTQEMINMLDYQINIESLHAIAMITMV